MSRIITFSRHFPAYHPRKGEPTYFREKIWAALADTVQGFEIPHEITDWDWHQYYNAVPKHHTIRAGNRWKVGDKFSPRVWSGKPYNSKQIIIAPDIEIRKVWDFEVVDIGGVYCIRLNNEPFGQFSPLAKGTQEIAKNDGLTAIELIQWFSTPSPIGKKFQIICWNDSISYI